MEQSFSLKRSLLLFKLIFINNVNHPIFKRMWITFIVIIVIASLPTLLTTFNLINPIIVPLSFVIIAILGFILSLSGYEQYRDKLDVCTSHMLPASVNEKFFIPFFTSFILILGMSAVVYVIWSLLQLVVGEGDSFDAIITNILNDYSIMSLFAGFLFAHSLCCLFSVLFKNGAATGFLVILVAQQMVRINVLIAKIAPERMSYLSSLPVSFWYCSMLILSLLFWFAAYTIFRKRQLNK